jgi:hypothetical protein
MSYSTASRSGSLQWKFLLSLQKLACKNGGFIFGGFARDSLIHEHYAKLYYTAREATYAEFYKEDKRDFKFWDYADPSIHPESWPHRALMPTDIDIAMDSVQKESFLYDLTKSGFHIKAKNPRKLEDYTGLTHHSDINHQKISVSLAFHPLFQSDDFAIDLPHINIDIVYKPDLQISDVLMYEHLDFQCNGLYITPDENFAICKPPNYNFIQCHKLIKSVIDDCVNFRAVPVKPSTGRLFKMVRKQFSIIAPTTTMMPKGGAEDDSCSLCLGTLHNVPCIKNNCCAAKYHPICYVKTQSGATNDYNNVDNCMVCRQPLNYTAEDHMYVNNYKHFYPRK